MGGLSRIDMNKRDKMLNLMRGQAQLNCIPAAFFMHFGPTARQGQAAIDKHLEFFRYTDMDFVKIQYEQTQPPSSINKPEDWLHVCPYPEGFFEPTIHVARELVRSAQYEALVIMTLFCPFWWAKKLVGDTELANHLMEDPEAVRKGLDVMAENVIRLAHGCRRVGVDGFFFSSQGGEAFRFKGADIFRRFIKPADVAVWDEIRSCTFNILHICDFHGVYEDLTPFFDYPGHVVNCDLKLGDKTLTPTEVARMFGRPFMGGLDRKGVIATGNPEGIRKTVEGVLGNVPEHFILSANCTVESDTPWDHLKTAVETAHQYQK